jgi:hypothetical protein
MKTLISLIMPTSGAVSRLTALLARVEGVSVSEALQGREKGLNYLIHRNKASTPHFMGLDESFLNNSEVHND